MPSILITGSNRGLGLEWARQYARAGWRVYATCRHPEQADDLQQLITTHSNVSLHPLDVTHADDIQNVATLLKNEPIDILLSNAGVYFEKFTQDTLDHIDYDKWVETFRVNTLGVMRIAGALVDNIARSDKRLVVAITSHMGSITDIETPGSYAYRSSKAALNAAMKDLSLELQTQGVGVLLLHPGWVKTRMGGPGALLTTEASVNGMRSIVDRFSMAMTGHFYRYDGSEIPW